MCPSTGLPVGLDVGQCQCGGISKFLSHTASITDATPTEMAKEVVKEWLWKQHGLHNPSASADGAA